MSLPVWYYAEDGQPVGPVGAEVVRERFGTGRMGPADLVWRMGMEDWVPVSEMPELEPEHGSEPGSAAGDAAGLVYAPLRLRVLAVGIDAAVGVVILTSLLILAYAVGEGLTDERMTLRRYVDLVEAGLVPICILLPWLYSALMESSRWLGTPGKSAMGLCVTSVGGERIGFGRATGRYAGKVLTVATLGLWFVLAAVTPKRQALHDVLAGTVVVRRCEG